MDRPIDGQTDLQADSYIPSNIVLGYNGALHITNRATRARHFFRKVKFSICILCHCKMAILRGCFIISSLMNHRSAFNPFPNNEFLDSSKLKELADNDFKFD